jgi:hypothetical protein
MGKRRKNNSAFLMSLRFLFAYNISDCAETNFFTGVCKVALRGDLSFQTKTKLLLLQWTEFNCRYRLSGYHVMFKTI